MDVHIRPGGLDRADVVALLDHHKKTCAAHTEEGSAHALDLTGLMQPDIRFFTAWEGETLLGTGALRRLSDTEGEIKSMHTAQTARRRGIGRIMLDHLIAEARAQGLRRVSLETGSWSFFIPAIALYKGAGFVECPPFGAYKPDPNSVFLTRLI